MPVPRRYDRRPPERDQTRINDRIRVPEVRLIGDDGKQIGVLKTSEALAYAQERDLDLVEVAADARPPVCRVLDYSKFKYEQAQKQKAARKHQQQITIREIKFRPKIAQNDYDTKKGHVERFLRGKDKVKVTIMFRGREVTHPERGSDLLKKLAQELEELCVVEQNPLQEGRNMTMMLAPSKAVLAGEFDTDEDDEQDAEKREQPVEHAEGAATVDVDELTDVEEDPSGRPKSKKKKNKPVAEKPKPAAEKPVEKPKPVAKPKPEPKQPEPEESGEPAPITMIDEESDEPAPIEPVSEAPKSQQQKQPKPNKSKTKSSSNGAGSKAERKPAGKAD
ncbi:MAG: translation initiation factor IF-3 [Solirubrobacterales bacterium]|nr:translation initiation factor IF-3 [Solirubrobacterales bacterium]